MNINEHNMSNTVYEHFESTCHYALPKLNQFPVLNGNYIINDVFAVCLQMEVIARWTASPHEQISVYLACFYTVNSHCNWSLQNYNSYLLQVFKDTAFINLWNVGNDSLGIIWVLISIWFTCQTVERTIVHFLLDKAKTLLTNGKLACFMCLGPGISKYIWTDYVN